MIDPKYTDNLIKKSKLNKSITELTILKSKKKNKELNKLEPKKIIYLIKKLNL